MAASGYKLFATGDVLTAADVNNYLMLQTVMVFANSAARTTALSAVLAEGLVSYLKDTDVVEIYTGAAWVSLDDPNAVQNAGYYAAGKNGIINAAMNNWQRGTSFTSDTNKYTADRWMTYRGVTSSTITRQATSDTTNLPFIQYCLRFQRNVGTTATGTSYISQSMDTATSTQFAGKSVVLSFYARAGANFSAASNAISVLMVTGTGTDQNAISGAYTGSTTVLSSTATLTTTWQRFTYTASIGATATEINPYVQWDSVGTAGANDYMEITGVQLEIGSTATAFQTASGTIQGELALCQRYYYRATTTDGYASMSNTGIGASTTVAKIDLAMPVTMRVAPTAVDYSTVAAWDTVTITAATSVTLDRVTNSYAILNVNCASGLTQFRPYYVIANNSTSAYIGVSAEL